MKYIIAVALAITVLIAAENNKIHIPNKTIKSEPTQIEKFLKRVAWIESGGNYRIVNRFGMMGKYQFSMPAVHAVGIRISQKEFLNNPTLQDTAMVRLMKMNEKELAYYIKRYEGKTVNGIKITRAGILAGAHFAGSGGIQQFFNGRITADANGTTITKYMSYFSNFHLPSLRSS
jgi:hypothetical protein